MANYQLRQKWRREEQEDRRELHPLRIAVNTALKRAGIPHSKTSYSGQVKGWPSYVSEGFETESMIFSNPKHIKVEITAAFGGISHPKNEARQIELEKLCEQSLKNFKYKKYGNHYEVYSIKNQPNR